MIPDKLDENGFVSHSRLSYWEMQSCRQQNILEAVRDETASVERLMHQVGIAQKGLYLAFRYGATESDAVTFLNLQSDLRDRLLQAPPLEVSRALANLAMGLETPQAG